MNEPKNTRKGEDFIRAQDLELIVSVNKKAIEINLEVERQNERVLTILEDFKSNGGTLNKKLEDILDEEEDINRKLVSFDKSLNDKIVFFEKNISEEFKDIKDCMDSVSDTLSDMKKKIEELERGNFKLYVLLGSGLVTGAASVIQLIMQLMGHK